LAKKFLPSPPDVGHEPDNRAEEATLNLDVVATTLHSPWDGGDEADNVAYGVANHHDEVGRGKIIHEILGNDCC